MEKSQLQSFEKKISRRMVGPIRGNEASRMRKNREINMEPQQLPDNRKPLSNIMRLTGHVAGAKAESIVHQSFNLNFEV